MEEHDPSCEPGDPSSMVSRNADGQQNSTTTPTSPDYWIRIRSGLNVLQAGLALANQPAPAAVTGAVVAVGDLIFRCRRMS
ncbi:hypothetical protein ACFXDE_16835 [Kitasatospora sp. NPDC059408]|uniref:hypothetical protein n=1 Tax=Kitasatospora sp. NPDC059408 TaxID=3346823 RepID=UPI0036B06BC3